MKAIILAAGRGSRLNRLTKTKPKCLVEVAGKPLLDYQLEAIKAAGVDDISVVTGYCAPQVRHSHIDHYFHNVDWKQTNMVYSLTMAQNCLQQSTCIVSYSDIFYQKQAVCNLIQSKHDVAITYDPNFLSLWQARFDDPLTDLETFKVDGSGLLQEIGAKATTTASIMGQYMGLIKITPVGWLAIQTLLKALPHAVFQRIDVTALLSLLIADGIQVAAIPYQGQWGEIDNERDYRLYNETKENGCYKFSKKLSQC